MPLYWPCYRHNNQISVVIEPGASSIHARMRAALAELDEVEFTEGHELDRKWRVPKEMMGRRLSQEEAKRLLAYVRKFVNDCAIRRAEIKISALAASALTGGAEPFFVALPTSGDLSDCAKDLFVEATGSRWWATLSPIARRSFAYPR